MAVVIADVTAPVLDNTIQPTADATVFRSDNGRIAGEYRQTGNQVAVTAESRTITWTPLDMKYVDEMGTEDSLYTVQEVPLEARGNFVRFNRTMPDIDDWFLAGNDQIKHNVLVQGFQRDPVPWLMGNVVLCFGGRLQFDVDLEVWADGQQQVAPFETIGAIELRNPATGAAAFTLPAVMAYDSAVERASTGGKYVVSGFAAGDLSFYLAVDNGWMNDPARVYPVVVDPTIYTGTLTNAASTTTRQRKLAVAPDGTMFLAWEDTTNRRFKVYKSTDNGATWAEITSSFGTNYSDQYVDMVCGSDNSLHIIFQETITSGGSVYIRHLRYAVGVWDKAAQISADVISEWQIYTVDGSRVLALNQSNTYESTDGGATWTARTSPNLGAGGGAAWWDGSTLYVVAGGGTSPYYPQFGKMTGNPLSTWSGLVDITTAYTCSFDVGQPQIVKLPSGVLLVVWGDRNVVTNLYYQISNDNGATWTAPVRVDLDGVAEQYCTLTLNEKTGQAWLYIRKGNTVPASIGYRVFDGTSWGSLVALTTGGYFQGGAPKKIPGTSYVPFWWTTSSTSGSVVESNVFVNTNPTAPTNLVRADFDRSLAADFTWAFSDPDAGQVQQSYQLLIKRVSDGVQVYDSGQVVSGTSKHTLPAGTLTSGGQYQWQVRVWDNVGGVSPYSQLATFYADTAPAAVIASPATNGATVYQPQVPVEWTVTDPDSGDSQSAYRVRLLNAGAAQLYDSGKKTGSDKVFTVPYTMATATTYQVEVTVWDSHGIQSAPVLRSFVTDFVLPPTPTVTVTPEAAQGRISIAYTNPAPDPGNPNQPAASSADVYRRETGGSMWTRIATGLRTNSAYLDYAVASGQAYDYYVRACAANTASADSAVASGSITLTGLWLHDVADPAGTALNIAYYRDRSEDWQPEAALLQFAGRSRPMVEFGEGEDARFKVSVMLRSEQGTWAFLDTLAKRRGTVCIRDPRGRKLFGALLALPETDEHYGQSVSLELVQTAYVEEV